MGISYEIEVVTIAIDEATSDDHCHFNQVCQLRRIITAKKPVKKCAERSEFFGLFSRFRPRLWGFAGLISLACVRLIICNAFFAPWG